MVTTKKLNTKDSINKACELLYNSYLEQSKWKFAQDNPSELGVENEYRVSLLKDRFTYEATWLGVFDEERLIGCCRLCLVGKDNKYEVEGYSSCDVIKSYLPSDDCLEITSVAFDPMYNGQRIINELYLIAFEHSEQLGKSCFVCTSNPYHMFLFDKIQFPLKIKNVFKYEESDPLSVNFYFADYKTGVIKNIITSLEKFQDNLNVRSFDIFYALEQVTALLPIIVYWHDVNGVILGLNDHCLKALGVTRDIIGKTPHCMYSDEMAEYILSHNRKVIETRQVMSQEETVTNKITGITSVYKSIKSPLYDRKGAVIGIVGASIDITAEKKSGLLQLENEAYKIKIATQEIFKQCLDEIQHTINSYKMGIINDKLGMSIDTPKNYEAEIMLSKRQYEVLYLLSLGKSPKDIANVLSKLEMKPVAPATIAAVINKQLYPKFNVYNVGQLIEKANFLRLIPFIPDSL